MQFREKLARFFYGRYGIDQLYYALFVLYFILWGVQLFVPLLPVRIGIYVLQAALLFWMTFRMLSKNVYKRRRENEAFMKIFRPVKNLFVLTKNRIRDVKGFRYRKCPHCKATLRLPKRKGEHSVICPRCKKRFTVKIKL